MIARHHFEGEAWREIKAEMLARLDRHRESNDRPQNTEVQTAIVRGRIQELKDLLALEPRAPAPDAGPE